MDKKQKKQKKQLFLENLADIGDKIIDITLVIAFVVIVSVVVYFLAVKALWFLMTMAGLVMAVAITAGIKTLVDIHKLTKSSTQRQNKEKKKD